MHWFIHLFDKYIIEAGEKNRSFLLPSNISIGLSGNLNEKHWETFVLNQYHTLPEKKRQSICRKLLN